jgi:hypothetical protein
LCAMTSLNDELVPNPRKGPSFAHLSLGGKVLSGFLRVP